MLRSRLVLIAFGANVAVGGRELEAVLLSAYADLAKAGLLDNRLSRRYVTPCFPPGAGPDYVNAVAAFSVGADWDAARILALLHEIEARNGRSRAQRWGARSLDLDLLALGDLVLPDAATQDHWRQLAPADQARLAPDQLILPHPRLQDRTFVLVPMADVAPDWRHPRLNLTVTEMLARLDPADRAAVRPL
jgi:2-amino-4-hydroxy-6-hydroxymethyldihydropteridine diphosphokinase